MISDEMAAFEGSFLNHAALWLRVPATLFLDGF